MVKIEDIEIVGWDDSLCQPSAQGRSMWDLYIKLSPEPPFEWGTIFGQEWQDHFYSMRRRARVEGAHIVIVAPPEEMKTHLNELDTVVQKVNRRYRAGQEEFEKVVSEEEAAERAERRRVQALMDGLFN